MNFIFIVFSIAIFGFCRAESQTTSRTDSVKNPKSVLDSPVEYSGWEGKSSHGKIINEFRIGFFLPSDSLNRLSQSLLNAAHLAIDEINTKKEDHGVIIKLVNRWSSDPWKGGAKELIKLVYQDSVLAVVGSIDGDGTHVAEQITTKARLPLFSPISADPTLTYIRIPWIFRLPPSYRAQAETLIKQGVLANNINKIGIVTENNHDGRIFGDELNKVLAENQIYPLFYFEVSKSDINFQSLTQRLLSFDPQLIILCLSKDNFIKLLFELGNNTQKIDVLMPWIPGLDYEILSEYYKGNIHYIEPFLRSPNLAYKVFADKYYNRYKSKPTFGAAYAYDAVYIVSNALQKSGPNRARLRKVISMMNNIQGVTGKITWDNGGGNIAQPIYRNLSGGKFD